MTDIDERPDGEIEEPETDSEATVQGSARDKIRARRKELQKAKTIDLLVPGYDDLAVRYDMLDDKESLSLAKRAQRAIKSSDSTKANEVTADLLIRSCQCILVRDSDEGALEPLVDDEKDPIKFDARLAEFLDIDTEEAREVVLETFSPEGVNPDAAAEHVEAMALWRRGRGEEINGALLGE